MVRTTTLRRPAPAPRRTRWVRLRDWLLAESPGALTRDQRLRITEALRFAPPR